MGGWPDGLTVQPDGPYHPHQSFEDCINAVHRHVHVAEVSCDLHRHEWGYRHPGQQVRANGCQHKPYWLGRGVCWKCGRRRGSSGSVKCDFPYHDATDFVLPSAYVENFHPGVLWMTEQGCF